MASDVSVDRIRGALIELFAPGVEESDWISLPHDVGLTPVEARMYERPVTQVRVEDLAEFLFQLEENSDFEFGFADLLNVSRSLHSMLGESRLDGLEEALEALSLVAWLVPRIHLFEDDLNSTILDSGKVFGITTSSEGISLLVEARVSPREVFDQASSSEDALVATAQKYELPVWVCHWLVNREWQIPELNWAFEEALREDDFHFRDPDSAAAFASTPIVEEDVPLLSDDELETLSGDD